MKKMMFVVTLCLAGMSLIACGKEQEEKNKQDKNVTEITESIDENKDNNPSDNSINVLSDDEIESAKEVALNYYSKTVFKVDSIVYIENSKDKALEGECNFSVNVSKDGAPLPTARQIHLNKKDDTWEVVGEGF